MPRVVAVIGAEHVRHVIVAGRRQQIVLDGDEDGGGGGRDGRIAATRAGDLSFNFSELRRDPCVGLASDKIASSGGYTWLAMGLVTVSV